MKYLITRAFLSDSHALYIDHDALNYGAHVNTRITYRVSLYVYSLEYSAIWIGRIARILNDTL